MAFQVKWTKGTLPAESGRYWVTMHPLIGKNYIMDMYYDTMSGWNCLGNEVIAFSPYTKPEPYEQEPYVAMKLPKNCFAPGQHWRSKFGPEITLGAFSDEHERWIASMHIGTMVLANLLISEEELENWEQVFKHG